MPMFYPISYIYSGICREVAEVEGENIKCSLDLSSEIYMADDRNSDGCYE